MNLFRIFLLLSSRGRFSSVLEPFAVRSIVDFMPVDSQRFALRAAREKLRVSYRARRDCGHEPAISDTDTVNIASMPRPSSLARVCVESFKPIRRSALARQAKHIPFRDQKITAPHTDKCEGRMFPPEQSWKRKQDRCQPSLPRKHRLVSAVLCRIYLQLCIADRHIIRCPECRQHDRHARAQGRFSRSGDAAR